MGTFYRRGWRAGLEHGTDRQGTGVNSFETILNIARGDIRPTGKCIYCRHAPHGVHGSLSPGDFFPPLYPLHGAHATFPQSGTLCGGCCDDPDLALRCPFGDQDLWGREVDAYLLHCVYLHLPRDPERETLQLELRDVVRPVGCDQHVPVPLHGGGEC